MFCPQCGTTQPDELNYCKSCGANISAVRTALVRGESGDSFDWKRTWVAEAMMTRDERDRRRGITPEMKRRREIKAGIITASAGFGVMVLLYVLMGGIILGGGVSDKAVAILSRLWVVGVVPLLVGLALIVNGVFISKRDNEPAETEPHSAANRLDPSAPDYLPAANTNEFIAPPHSVTDETTKHLRASK